MRLLIVTQYFWPENFRINDLALELANRGHDVTVLTSVPNYPEGSIFVGYASNPNLFANYLGIEILRVPIILRGQGGLRLLLNYLSFTLMASFLGPWKLRGHKFDAVLTCQLSPVTVGLPGALLARLKKAPMAMWVLDLWPDTLKAIGVVKSEKLLKLVGLLTSFIYRRCDLILAQSKSFVPKIEAAASFSVPVVYFPSWAETIFNKKTITPAVEVPIRSGAFNVMFAGNVGEAQDFACILSAAVFLKAHKHIRWLIVGDGRMSTWVHSEIEAQGLSECVSMLGRYPVERMPEFFLHADAMLVTLADKEIFAMTIPGKLQSYLAAGMPVIAALNGEGAELVQHANAGLVCPAGDARALATCVMQMSGMSVKERQAMGQRGLELSKSEFDREEIVGMAEKHLLGLLA
jgi:colanic acid biosynthesis glycosyl transferase WcaI